MEQTSINQPILPRRAFLGLIVLTPAMWRGLFKQRDALTVGDSIAISLHVPEG